MNRDDFAKCFDLPMDYYGKTMTDLEWGFYFDELGGMTIPDLEKAIARHMASLKSFPLTSHLRPERKTQIQTDRKRRYDEHDDFARTNIACINIFHARVEGSTFAGKNTDATYPVNVDDVVAQGMAYYNGHLEELGEHTVMSQCKSGMHRRLIKEFEELL